MLTFIVLPHCCIKSQTLYLVPPQSYYTNIWATYPENLSAKRGATSTIFTTLVFHGQESNLVLPVLGADSIYCTMEAGVLKSFEAIIKI